MNILAIDPGTTKSAWVLYDSETKTIGDHNIDDNHFIAAAIIPAYCMAAEQGVIEMMQCMGMAVGQSVLETCRWIGRFEETFLREKTHVSFIYRSQEKMHLCQSMRAKDGNIRQALIDKLGPPGTKKAPGPTYGISKDVWAALAVAVTYAETRDALGIGSTGVEEDA